DDAAAEMRETLAHMPDCIRILIQSQNISATSKESFGVAAAAAGSIHDEQAWFRLEELKDFPLEHRAMIDKIFDDFVAFFRRSWIDREQCGTCVPKRTNDLLAQHRLTNQSPLLHAGK